MLSTPIQDTLWTETKELPSNIDLPNVCKGLTQTTLDIFEWILKFLPDMWNVEIDFKHSAQVMRIDQILETAISLDMRPIMSYIIWCCTAEYRCKYLKVMNIMKACIENCNGAANKLLQMIISLNDRKTYQLAIYLLDDFIAMEQNSKITLIEVCDYSREGTARQSLERRFLFVSHDYPRLVPVKIKSNNYKKYLIEITDYELEILIRDNFDHFPHRIYQERLESNIFYSERVTLCCMNKGQEYIIEKTGDHNDDYYSIHSANCMEKDFTIVLTSTGTQKYMLCDSIL